MHLIYSIILIYTLIGLKVFGQMLLDSLQKLPQLVTVALEQSLPHRPKVNLRLTYLASNIVFAPMTKAQPLEIFGGLNGRNILVLEKVFDEAKKRGINL